MIAHDGPQIFMELTQQEGAYVLSLVLADLREPQMALGRPPREELLAMALFLEDIVASRHRQWVPPLETPQPERRSA